MGRQAGQSVAEFALTIGIFTVLLIGTLDLARAVYLFNGVSEAAREIARTTSIFPGGDDLGSSGETATTLSTQQALLPGLGTPSYACIDIAGAAVSGRCDSGEWVEVTVAAPYQPATPFVSFVGPITFSSTSSAEIQ
jgi:hypothetical protein